MPEQWSTTVFILLSFLLLLFPCYLLLQVIAELRSSSCIILHHHSTYFFSIRLWRKLNPHRVVFYAFYTAVTCLSTKLCPTELSKKFLFRFLLSNSAHLLFFSFPFNFYILRNTSGREKNIFAENIIHCNVWFLTPWLSCFKTTFLLSWLLCLSYLLETLCCSNRQPLQPCHLNRPGFISSVINFN